MRAKQTNQKYDEAEQKSQAWMKAKDEAQSHKRMWHSYWQQAMVSPPSYHPLTNHSHLYKQSVTPVKQSVTPVKKSVT